MTKKKIRLFFIVEKLSDLNLDYVKKTGAILIIRHPEKFKKDILKNFKTRCDNRNLNLFIPNDIKTLFFLKSNRFYISAYNKKHYKHLKKINSKIEIIGSAHNTAEITEKIKQGCDYIILSRVFETSNKFKKGHLGITKFNLITRRFSQKFLALGGINENNFKKLNALNVNGCVILKDKKNAGKYMPAFFKNNL